MRFTPPTDAELIANFVNQDMQPADPDTITVDLFDPNGVQLVNDDPGAVRLGLGEWQYTYALAADVPFGTWSLYWHVVIDGVPVEAREDFDVLPAGIDTTSDLVMNSALRARVGESKAVGDPAGANTMFTDEEVSEILVMTSHSLDAATLEAWERKAARLQRLIDFHESGTERNLSRKFIQAKQMVDYWFRVISSTTQIRSQALAGRVVGVPVRLRGDTPSAPILTGVGSMYERMYPTHRAFMIPAILG